MRSEVSKVGQIFVPLRKNEELAGRWKKKSKKKEAKNAVKAAHWQQGRLSADGRMRRAWAIMIAVHLLRRMDADCYSVAALLSRQLRRPLSLSHRTGMSDHADSSHAASLHAAAGLASPSRR